MGIIQGTIMGIVSGDPRSLGHSSCELRTKVKLGGPIPI